MDISPAGFPFVVIASVNARHCLCVRQKPQVVGTWMQSLPIYILLLLSAFHFYVFFTK